MSIVYRIFPAFWQAHYGAEKLGCITISGAGQDTKGRIKMIQDLDITVLMCTPTYALRMIYVAEEEMNIDLSKETNVHVLINAGEAGANVPSTKKSIEEGWGAFSGDYVGMTEEGGIMAFECAEQPGGVHIIEDNFIEEVLDPKTLEPVGYGEKGVRVTTSIGREILPMFRYWSNDYVVKEKWDYCSCGRKFDIYKGGMLGRYDDMVKIRGVMFYPQLVEDVIRTHSNIREFFTTVERIKEQDELLIKIECYPSVEQKEYSDIQRIVAEELRAKLGFRAVVEVVPPDTLPVFELKAKRFKDNRPISF